MIPFLIILIEFTSVVQSVCQIDPLGIKPTPIFLNRNGQILYPNSKSHLVTINHDEDILISCPGSRLLHDQTELGEYITATCGDNEILNFGNQPLEFYSLKCQDIPKDTVRYTQRSCPDGGEEIEIGFIIRRDMFLRQMKICFDNINLTPIYSHYNLTGDIGYRDSSVPRKFFEEDGFYSTSYSLDYLYRRDNERRTINSLLDLDQNSEAYIKRNGELFINRGHLTAKGDFVYAFQQLATFHYVNSAPQWASFNGGNWNELEMSLRDYASSTGSEFEVYTGTYGITSLKNSKNGRKTQLFLHAIDGKNHVPVPQLFWKMVYNRKNSKGVVILGVNNAYEFDVEDDLICKDISDNISWFNRKLVRNKHDIELGYIYACSIEDFRKTVTGSPTLISQGSLT